MSLLVQQSLGFSWVEAQNQKHLKIHIAAMGKATTRDVMQSKMPPAQVSPAPVGAGVAGKRMQLGTIGGPGEAIASINTCLWQNCRKTSSSIHPLHVAQLRQRRVTMCLRILHPPPQVCHLLLAFAHRVG